MAARRLWFALLLLAILVSSVALLLSGSRFNIRQRLFAVTGEEALVPQLRGLIQWAFRWTRLLPQTAADVPVSYTNLPPFGVNTFLEQEVETAKRELSIQMIADAGFHWLRQSFPWYDIEIHGKGDFEDRRHEPPRSAWEKYDNIVDLTAQYGLDLIVRLEAPPVWSRQDGIARGEFGPPDNFADYTDYAAAVASRYQGRLRFYQVWNEPNIYPEWGNQPVDPEAYTELLCQTYRRIKAIDPEAVIISGALAPTAELGSWNPSYQGNNLMDVVYLQRMYNAGAGECFDVLAVNDYMLWSGPTDQRMRPTQGNINFSRPLWVRDVMVANGDAHKPIWLSEMNSNVAPDDIYPRYGRVTIEQQARYAPLAYEQIQHAWPWAGVTTVWFFKRATDLERDQPMYYFRMVEPDFTPTPLYTSLSAYLNTLEPVLYQGYHQENTWQLEYTGPWEEVADTQAILSQYYQASAAGAQVSFTWEGRSITLLPGNYETGTLQVIEDEGNSKEIPLNGQPVVLSRHLLSAQRKLELIVVDGQVTLDALQVK
ncbi:MAG: hypothetical protein JW981_05645 [Anaerolineae bacterium]|nr:hypothetical protein [Anaerolineae bacterium]